jgi:hypothetical protein
LKDVCAPGPNKALQSRFRVLAPPEEENQFLQHTFLLAHGVSISPAWWMLCYDVEEKETTHTLVAEGDP